MSFLKFKSLVLFIKIDVSFSCVCLVFDNAFRPNIVKVVCGSTRLSPRRSTASFAILDYEEIHDY